MKATCAVTVAATLILAGCGDSSGPGDNQGGPPPAGGTLAGLALSAPVPNTTGSNAGATVVFVSVAPGTVDRAASAEIKSSGARAQAVAALEGGFDPVGVPGKAGDQVDVVITDSAGTKTTVTGTAKQGTRPRVVRTSPAPRKTDVPLNAIMRVVFSAPMTLQSVQEGLQLTTAGTPVAGTVVASDASGLVFDLQPSAPLEPGVAYEIVIAPGVMDVNGTSLGETVTTEFTTGTGVAGTGTVRVITTTIGERIDADGYVARVTVPPYQRSIGANDTLLVQGWPAGGAFDAVSLEGVSINCLVDGNGQSVRVTAGATTTVLFTVRCARGSQLTVVTSTSGSDLDPDGYFISLAGAYVPIATNGSYVFPDVLPGHYSLTLEWVSPNCSHDRVDFPGFYEGGVTMAGSDVTATFVVNCLAVRQLAAVAGDGPGAEIYLINSNGVGQTRLTSNAALDDDPAWSPDGSRIVFSSDRDGNREIYVMNANGSGQVRLTNSAGADYQPAWSPDGNWIAFVSDRDGNAEVYRMNVDGSSLLRLTSAGGDDLDPTWSPDGGRVAFSSSRSGPAHIYVMNADGGGQVQITFDKPTLVGALQPAWSPDGASIAFVGQQLGENAEAQRIIHRVAPDGSAEGYLGSSPEKLDGVSDPAWSADGRQLSASSGACQGCGTGIQMHRTSDGAYTGALIYDASGATVLARNAAWRP